MSRGQKLQVVVVVIGALLMLGWGLPPRLALAQDGGEPPAPGESSGALAPADGDAEQAGDESDEASSALEDGAATPEATPSSTPPPSPLDPPADPAATISYFFPTRGIKDVTFSFESRAALETIIGVTNKAEGKFLWNEVAGEGAIEIVVDATSLRTGIELRDEHLRGPRWLDTKQFPTISFRASDVSPVEEREGWFDVDGEMTIRGVSHEVTALVEARTVPMSAETEEAGFGKGDVAIVRGEFELKLSDYGIIVPQQDIAKVSNTIKVQIDLFASADPGRYRLAEEANRSVEDTLALP
jgi:polyisoprenoid-binding protein YceI